MAMNMLPEAAKSLVEQFNRLYPVGYPILLIKDLGEVVETTVKWPAEVTVNGPMIGLSGLPGKWLLDRVIPLKEKDTFQLSPPEVDRLVEFLELTATGPAIFPEDAKFWANLAVKIYSQIQTA